MAHAARPTGLRGLATALLLLASLHVTDSAGRGTAAAQLPLPPPRRAAASAATARLPPPKPAVPTRCTDLPSSSTRAADIALASGPGVLYADFIWGCRKFKLEGELRAASRGKVLVLPTNTVMQRRFARLGLYRQLGHIPPAAVASLRKLVQTGVAYRRSAIPPRHGCGYVYASHELGNMRRLRLSDARAAAAAALTASGAGDAAVSASFAGDPQMAYSVLGQGYNVMTGLPLSVGMSSLDPGFSLQPVFALNASYVATMPNTGGACQSQFSTSVYYSAQDFKEQIGAGLNVGADFGIASLTANVNFDMLTTTSSTTQTVTTNSGAKVLLGGYGLRAGPGGLPLDPAFVANVRPIVRAAVAQRYDQYAMQSLLDNYGTHYVSRVFWGGLASVTSQMTSATYSSFQSIDVSVSVAAQVAMVQVSASVDYSSTTTNTVKQNSQTFGEILIPALVNLTLANTAQAGNPGANPSGGVSFIDCVQWTNDLKDAINSYGWRPPVEYSVAPLTQLFGFPDIWPADMRPGLKAARDQLYRYITTCGYNEQFDSWATKIAQNASYNACPVVDSRCVKGSYRTRSGGCRTCYGDGTTVGPMCNSTAVVACSPRACFCQPFYAPAGRIYDCQPLAGEPSAYGEQNIYIYGSWWGQNGKGNAVAWCPAGLVISNIFAPRYGAFNSGSCNASDSARKSAYREVYRYCIGQTQCSVPASNEVFYNPCSGVLKTLTFSWECDYPRFAAAPSNGNTAVASCPGNCLTVGNIIRPVYGRLDSNKCNATSSYAKVAAACDVAGRSKQSCSITNSLATFDNSDPCQGVAKYLQFHYTCTFPPPSGEKTATATENQNISLDCGCQRVSEIWEAQWVKASGTKDGCSARDVNYIMRPLCLDRYGTACTLNATNANMGGDPCSGEQKKLTLKYRCI